MEQSALDYLGLDPETTTELVGRLKATCRRFGGDFVLLWHNDQLLGRRGRAFYEAVLDCG
jgi:hypothetical protein